MSNSDWVHMFDGVRRRILADGVNMMLGEVELKAGAVVPRHRHVHEQITFVHRGRLLFELDDRSFELGEGEAYVVPSNQWHEVSAIEDSLAADSFSPPREDFRLNTPPDPAIYSAASR